MNESAELEAWLRLTLIPGLGGAGQRMLLSAFGSPRGVLDAPKRVLFELVGPTLARAINVGADEAVVSGAIAWMGEPRHHIVALGDETYPPQLLEIPDPPSVLYVIGRLDLLRQPGLAVVGSRTPTPQGISNARAFSQSMSEAGLTITSGLALGIDTAAHEGGLSGPGSTIAVLGTGVDIAYPRRNRALYESIADAGAVVSEFPLGTPPLAGHFPRRNRVISGLAQGCLVVEAALASGSLITARMAAEQGREVFAIPGSIHSPLAKGCHSLIKQGAKLVESAADLLEELGRRPGVRSDPVVAGEPVAGAALGVLAHMGFEPVSLDSLCQRSGLTPNVVSAMLLDLELAGKVATLPGGRFERLS